MQPKFLHVLLKIVIMLLWTLNRNKSYSYIQHINEVKYQTFSPLLHKVSVGNANMPDLL